MALILVVDDDAESRLSLIQVLRAAGHETVSAVDGLEALIHVEANAVEVVVTDIDMPEMDGIELTINVRWRWPDLPVIVVTGAAPMLLEDANVRGANATFSKPLDYQALLDVIEDLVSEGQV